MLNELEEYVTEQPYLDYIGEIKKVVVDATGPSKSTDEELAMAREKIEKLQDQVKVLTASLVAARSGAVSLQCLLDSSRGKLKDYEAKELSVKKDVTPAPSKQLVTDMKKAFKDIELVASRQYEVAECPPIQHHAGEADVVKKTAAVTRIQAAALAKKLRRLLQEDFIATNPSALRKMLADRGLITAGKKLDLLKRLVKHAERIGSKGEMDGKSAGGLSIVLTTSDAAVDDPSFNWQTAATSRTFKIQFDTEEFVISHDGGKENLDITEEEKEEAERLKKERQREEMREKIQKQKMLLREKKAEEAARKAAQSPKLTPEPEPTVMNDFAAQLLGLGVSEPEPVDAESSSESGSDVEDSGGNPLFSGSSESDADDDAKSGNPLFDGGSDDSD